MFEEITLPLTDEETIVVMTSLLLIFSLLTALICMILIVQIKKSEKIARPFLSSLMIYFLSLTIANILQVLYNISNFNLILVNIENLEIYSIYFVFLLTYFAPIYLIYQIEKKFFPEMKIQSKYHLFSILSLIIFVIFNIRVLVDVFSGMDIFAGFDLKNYLITTFMIFSLQLLYITFAFFYLGYKAMGKYRKYAILVSVGWIINNIANVITTLFYVIPSSRPLYFILKYLGVIIVAYCLFKFYTYKGA